MTEIPPENYAKTWTTDARPAPPLAGDEREVLVSFLDFQRATFELKCAGVPPGRLAERTVPPSELSLHGLTRHPAGVERWWFRQQFAGHDLPMLHYSDDDPEQDFTFREADFPADLALWREECAQSRVVVAAAALDDTGTGGPGSPCPCGGSSST